MRSNTSLHLAPHPKSQRAFSDEPNVSIASTALVRGLDSAVTTAYNEIKTRRSTAFFSYKTPNDEARLCAYYATDRQCTLALLCLRLRTRLTTVRRFLLAWGVHPKTRQILPRTAESEAA